MKAKIKSCLRITFILILLMNLPYTVFSQHLAYKHYTYKERLPVKSILSIHGLESGEILIGSVNNSITMFDGNTFFEYTHDQNKHIGSIISITDVDGKVYLLSNHDGIYKIENNKIKTFFISKKIDAFLGFVKSENGFYLIYEKGILFIDKNAQQKAEYIFPNNKTISSVTNVINYKEGVLVLSKTENYILKNGNLKTLDQYYNTKDNRLSKFDFGIVRQNQLDLYDSYLEVNLKSDLSSKTYSISPLEGLKSQEEELINMVHNKQNNQLVFLSKNGDLIIEKKNDFKRYYNNSETLKGFSTIYSDRYGNQWLGNTESGLFKANFTLFNKLNYSRIFRNPKVYFTHQINEKELIFSTIEPDKTYIGNLYDSSFTNYPFRIFDKYKGNTRTLFATSNGIYFLENESKLTPVSNDLLLKGKSFNAVCKYKNGYLVFENGSNPISISRDYKTIQKIELPQELRSCYIQTAYYSEKKDQLYFGTKNGIYRWNYTYNTVRKLTDEKTSGNCANYTRDIYGTVWFTTEKGMFGITSNENTIILNNPEIFKNTVLYNLQADSYGQILIGTNRGFLIIKVNNEGEVISHSYFDSSNGFEGYDTHSHSSSIFNNIVFIGTSDGIFSIDFNFHNNKFTPNKPEITAIELSGNDFSFTTVSKHPQFKEIYYSYKIVGGTEDWSKPLLDEKYTISNLPAGEVNLLIRSSYDKIHFSNILSYKIDVKYSLLNSSVAIYALLIFAIITNILIYNRIRRKSVTQDFYKEDFFILQNVSPYLILYTGIVNVFLYLLVFLFIPNIHFNPILLITGIIITLSLFIFAVNIRNDEQKFKKVKRVLAIAFLYILLQNEFILYQSEIHPFLCIMIIVVVNFAPFIYERTMNILLFSILFFSLNVAIIFAVNQPLFPSSLFLISIGISATSILLMNIIRHQSISRLAFSSALMNRSDIYVLSFDSKGFVHFSSKNLSRLLGVEEQNIIGQKISFLKNYIPVGLESWSFESPKDFEEEKVFNVPIKVEEGKIVWLNWKMKSLEKNIFVLIGNDITEKVSLQNTYEIMVENAHDLIYQVNDKGEFKFLNNKFNDYLLNDKNSYIGMNLIDIIHADFKEEVFNFYVKQFKSKEKITYLEFPIIDKFNQKVWIGQYVTLLIEPGYENKVIGFFALGRDVTDQRNKEQLITAQNIRIQDSILYAKRIQNNLLSNGNHFNDFFDEHLIVYEPKDIVSGDFFWSNRINGLIVVAVGDCTGHGVPGAFMSILVINLLDSIIKHSLITDPGMIMNELDQRLKNILSNQKDVTFRDGVELSICVFDETEPILQYCCAGSKFIIHNGQTHEVIKGETKHIGDEQDNFKGYVSNNIVINRFSTIYLFTDGFQDQFGGIHNKKFSIRRLIEMFLENINLPLQNQETTFRDEFNKWKGQETQTDDITIIGIRPFKNE